ncbi:MAG: 1-acyl-sn-glycerol-3-phosphate acyltransferase, partial [Lautropia mirabilis]
MIPALRRAARLPLLTLLLVAGLVGLALVQPWLPQQGRRVLIRWWSCLLMRICGVKVQETWAGDPTRPRTLAELAPGRLLVANHVSWLDIFAINSLATSAFVA